MGLIRALVSATSTALGDQFKEFVDCPQVDNNVIIQRGTVHHGSGNPGAQDGIISAGSAIVVPEGMAMMIIDNGKVTEFTAEPGTFTWDTSSEPSIFTGGLGKGILNTFKTIGSRFTFGGQTAKDQRVYYVNIKTIPGNTFGSQQPETIFDPVYGSVEVTYNGEYALKVDDPIVLVNNFVGANAKDTLTFDDIFAQNGQNQLKGKFAQKISEAISDIMTVNNVSFNRIQSYKSQVTEKMNDLLDTEWKSKYGIIVEDVTLRINASEEARKVIQEMDRNVAETTRMGQVYSNNLTGTMAAAAGEAMKNAATNEAGSMMGFMGMNMATQAGANMIGTVANIEQNKQQAAPQTEANTATEKKYCTNCGREVTTKFCGNCGTQVSE
ncbi:MAG: SPFH domain-containing protein [Bacilli bacterium]|nr:SPFH domain-containing protein [Bacilli bacterium]